MVAPDIEKEAQEFKAGKTGEEAWAERMIKRGAEERGGEAVSDQEKKEIDDETLGIAAEEEAKAKTEAARAERTELPPDSLSARVREAREARLASFESFEARDESGAVAQIPAEFAKTEIPVRPEFSRYPEPGTLMYLEKGSRVQFYESLIPKSRTKEGQERVQPFVSKLPENTVYIKTTFFQPEEVGARKVQAEDMRQYLTPETLAQLNLSVPEAETRERVPVA